MAISTASLLRCPPPSLRSLRTQPSLLTPLGGGLVSRPIAVTPPSLSLPSRPTRRVPAASSDDGPLETATTAVNKLKEWWNSLSQQPSHLPTTTAFWKKRAQQWLDAFETGFCILLVALLIRMGIPVLSALVVAAMLKVYLNIRREYRGIEAQDLIDRIAHKQRSEAMEKRLDDNNKEVMQ